MIILSLNVFTTVLDIIPVSWPNSLSFLLNEIKEMSKVDVHFYRCRLQRLHCHVTYDFMRKLPSSLTELWIAVNSNHQLAHITLLHSVTLPYLQYLRE